MSKKEKKIHWKSSSHLSVQIYHDFRRKNYVNFSLSINISDCLQYDTLYYTNQYVKVEDLEDASTCKDQCLEDSKCDLFLFVEQEHAGGDSSWDCYLFRGPVHGPIEYEDTIFGTKADCSN